MGIISQPKRIAESNLIDLNCPYLEFILSQAGKFLCIYRMNTNTKSVNSKYFILIIVQDNTENMIGDEFI